MQLAHALNGIGLRVLCVRLEVRSGRCLLQREASGLALHPSVKGYCRPDLPAHYREKIGFVLWRMVTDRRQKACFSSQSAGLLGLAGGTSGRIFFEGAQRGEEGPGSLPQERFLAANKIGFRST
ncbi:hypothetical protein AO284_07255 [Pseudomonas sp. NZIPFR-PS2]|uniref:Uncharacterized protein n=1 Tax=Pseudomonas simiae TaxID=321846 RepID=U1TNM7_9PSED|nr:hypothetical protein PS417_21760 [Pseudomonas simiae]PHX38246.1 hypothetical protein AO284_07255 [Pseudomonas sp. NZIPFR-PS2]TKJ97265.1 hypothetical protein PflCFBP13514_27425 [Pseudomonas fluorescens]AJZ97108.1 hypothetical protein PFLUOLIPICF7_14790 [Pseudomonas simiae]ERH60081.1 hypothetical protein O204_20500 [Pseudomonas simiae]